MIYLTKNNKKNTFKKKILLLILFCLVLLLFSFKQFYFVNNSLSFVAKPLGNLKNSSVEFSKDFISFLIFKINLVEENKLLKEELIKNKLSLISLKMLSEENLVLKEIFNRTELTSKLILANVILKPGLSAYNSLLVDVGNNFRVEKGNKILAGDNIIIGEVEEVYSKTSKVKLYSFPNDEMAVAVGFEKLLTVAKGKGDGVFEIKLPQGININKGDIVTLPEESLRILGVVEEIIINPEDPFEKILVKSPVNFFELRWVQIIQE